MPSARWESGGSARPDDQHLQVRKPSGEDQPPDAEDGRPSFWTVLSTGGDDPDGRQRDADTWRRDPDPRRRDDPTGDAEPQQTPTPTGETPTTGAPAAGSGDPDAHCTRHPGTRYHRRIGPGHHEAILRRSGHGRSACGRDGGGRDQDRRVVGRRPTSPQQTVARASFEVGRRSVAACAFEPGERAAFSLQLNAEATGVQDQGDLFKAVLSWEVVAAPRPDEWLLRAAFSSTELRQPLSRPEQRVTQPLDGHLHDPSRARLSLHCEGIPARLEARHASLRLHGPRQFRVRRAPTAIRAELGDRPDRWARSLRSPIRRRGALRGRAADDQGEDAYLADERAMGVDLQIELVGAKAEATLDARGRLAAQRASGREQVRISVQGNVLAELEQRYQLTRDDARFARAGPRSPDRRARLAGSVRDGRAAAERAGRSGDCEALLGSGAEALLRDISDAQGRCRTLRRCSSRSGSRHSPNAPSTLLAALRDGEISEALRAGGVLGARALRHAAGPRGPDDRASG